MIGYFSRRVAQAILTFFVATALVFCAMRALPGNPLMARFGQHPVPEQFAAIMAEQGWDRPLHRQLGDFYWKTFTRGDFGESFVRPSESIRDELMQRIPATIELTLAAVILAMPLGIAAGIIAAVWRGRWPDYVCMGGALVGVSVPVFFLGIVLVIVFSGLPTGSRLPPGSGFQSATGFVLIETLFRGRFDLFFDGVRHLILPAVALSSIPMAMIARMTRASMIEVLSADFVRTARAKGGSHVRVVLRHALPNAAVPIANLAGYQIGVLLTGAVLTETVFSWPGLGRYMVDAIKAPDYPVVQATALIIAAMFVTLNLLLDMLYAWLDPRIRLG